MLFADTDCKNTFIFNSYSYFSFRVLIKIKKQTALLKLVSYDFTPYDKLLSYGVKFSVVYLKIYLASYFNKWKEKYLGKVMIEK